MQSNIETESLQEAIRIITRLAPPVSGNIGIHSDGKKLFLNSYNDTARCEINLPADVSGKECTFAVSITALRDATKGRKSLQVAFDKTLCKIKSGAYKCELPTVDSMEIEEQEDEKSKPIKIDAEQAKWLRSAIGVVALKPTPLLSPFMPLSVKLSKNGAFVSCYDSSHMAFISSKEIQGKLEAKLPVDMFMSILDAFDKSAFRLELSQSSLYVSNQLVKVVIALPQEDENDLKLEEVIETVRSTKEAKGQMLAVDKAEILKFLDNSRAVATKERSEVKVSVADGKMRLEVITSNGTIKALIKAEGKDIAKMMIDFEFLDEAIRKSGDRVEMKIVGEDFISFKLLKGTVIVAQNQLEE